MVLNHFGVRRDHRAGDDPHSGEHYLRGSACAPGSAKPALNSSRRYEPMWKDVPRNRELGRRLLCRLVAALAAGRRRPGPRAVDGQRSADRHRRGWSRARRRQTNDDLPRERRHRPGQPAHQRRHRRRPVRRGRSGDEDHRRRCAGPFQATARRRNQLPQCLGEADGVLSPAGPHQPVGRGALREGREPGTSGPARVRFAQRALQGADRGCGTIPPAPVLQADGKKPERVRIQIKPKKKPTQ